MARRLAFFALLCVGCASASELPDEPSFVEFPFFKRRSFPNETINPRTNIAVETSPEQLPEEPATSEEQEGGEPATLPVPGVADGLQLEGEAPLTPESQPKPEDETPTMRFFRLVREVFLAVRPRLD
ncbi:hypothetical protein ACSSS7_003149 [Eimeria intestinalis]